MEIDLRKFIPKKNQWFVVLLIGILLVIIAIPTKSEPESNVDVGSNQMNLGTSDMEKRLENLLKRMKNVGEVQVMITYREEQQVEGIVVLAEGAKNAIVVRDITSVIQALFDVDSHKIKVIEGKQSN